MQVHNILLRFQITRILKDLHIIICTEVHVFYNEDMDGNRTSMTEPHDLASYLRIANSGEQVVVTVDGNHLLPVRWRLKMRSQ